MSVLHSCPADNFAASMWHMTKKGYKASLIPSSEHTEKAYTQYLQSSTSTWCFPNPPTAMWPMSQRPANRPLIINAGEGSTGSSFMDCVYDELGFNSRHGVMTGQMGFGSKGCEPSCTEGWDRYDYISDSPVQYQLWPLLKTHPDALVLLPTRDPAQWQRARLDAHKDQGAADWYQAAPCGRAAHKLAHTDSPTSFVVYNVWVDCVVPPKNLFTYNLFDKSETAANTIWRMVDFLKSRNVTIPNEGRNLSAIEEHCSARKEPEVTSMHASREMQQPPGADGAPTGNGDGLRQRFWQRELSKGMRGY